MRSILYVALFAATTAGAQNMYKCSSAGKVEYSDRPCSRGEAVKQIAPDGGPTPEDRARAHMRYNAERARFDAQDRAEALNRANRAEAADVARAQADLDAAAAAAAKQANEKVTTHGRDGWDLKPRAQVAAEQEARTRARAAANAGLPPPVVTGASSPNPGDWQSERIMTHDRTGWTPNTRDGVVQEEAERAYASQKAQNRAAAEASQGPRTLVNCDPAGCWDTQGKRYNGGAGGVFFSTDGRTCIRAGTNLNCN
jgi:hypothetical protein